MGKGRKPADTPAEPAEGGPEKEISLKVTQETGRLVGKIAAHRNLSVKKLFQERDLEDFLMHMLIEEMRKEGERLKAQQPRR